MVGVNGRISVGNRIRMGFVDEVEFSGGETLSLTTDDSVFGFLDVEGSTSESCLTTDGGVNDIVENKSNDEKQSGDYEVNNATEKMVFWEMQHQLLQSTITRSSSLESRIRNATKLVLKESKLSGTDCICRIHVDNGCLNCLLRSISDYLRNIGYNSAICKSNWRSSPHIPSGEHIYIDVLDNSSSNKGEIKIVIELNFRAEFEMARASEDYNRLTNRLPEVYVGKSERLLALIKIMCSAAKKCMKENKMHMGPWRKQKYMEAKWFGTCERFTSIPIIKKGFSSELKKPRRTCLLTFDLVESLNSRVVEVV